MTATAQDPLRERPPDIPLHRRHARHTSDPHHRRRATVFDSDAAQVRAYRKEAETGAGLRLIDGELVDPGTGEVHE